MRFLILFIVICAGFTAGYLTNHYKSLKDNSSDSAINSQESDPKPLYWVAPMDPNFRRDRPGKSPMGMDLIPVYPETDNSENNLGNVGNKGNDSSIKINPQVQNNISVQTSALRSGKLHQAVHAIAYVRYNEDSLVHIHPRLSGWVEVLYVKASGEAVKKGQPLYSLYSPELVNAQDEYLLALNNGSQRLIKGAEARLKALKISDSFIKKLRKSKRTQQNITFYAKQSGFVENLNIRQGFYVEPGTNLMSIVNLNSVWIEAEILEADSHRISVGQIVELTTPAGVQLTSSAIEYIHPSIDSQSKTLIARATVDNTELGLKPNTFLEARIPIANEKEYWLAPKSSVIQTEQDNRIIIQQENGNFKAISVQILDHDRNFYAISSGNEQPQSSHLKIVTNAQFLLDSESSRSQSFQRLAPQVEGQKEHQKDHINHHDHHDHHNMQGGDS